MRQIANCRYSKLCTFCRQIQQCPKIVCGGVKPIFAMPTFRKRLFLHWCGLNFFDKMLSTFLLFFLHPLPISVLSVPQPICPYIVLQHHLCCRAQRAAANSRGTRLDSTPTKTGPTRISSQLSALQPLPLKH